MLRQYEPFRYSHIFYLNLKILTVTQFVWVPCTFKQKNTLPDFVLNFKRYRNWLKFDFLS